MKSLKISRRAILIAMASLVASGTIALAASYSYKCPKCGLIQTFDRPNPGVKCPNDNFMMSPK